MVGESLKELDYSHHPKPKRHFPSSALIAGTWMSSEPHTSLNAMAPPPSTIAPTALQHGLPIAPFDYNPAYSAPDDIDSLVASAYNQTLTPQDRPHYQDPFYEELLDLQGHHNRDVEPRPRQPNEPWAILNPTVSPPTTGRRPSEPGYVDPTAERNILSGLNPQTYGYSSTNTTGSRAYSDCGRAFGDSGYGGSFGVISPATRSKTSWGDFATPSVFSGDVSTQQQESLSITGGLDGLEFQSQTTEVGPYDPFAEELPQHHSLHPALDPSRDGGPPETSAADGPPWNCSTCDAPPFKSKSEHKKHMLRHLKPFKCEYANCSRQNLGFSTRNDLDRHRKSIHKVAPGTSTDKTFMCAAPNCRNKDKRWPRADNFRQHCLRLHPDIDIEYLVRASACPKLRSIPRDDVANLDKTAPSTASSDISIPAVTSRHLVDPQEISRSPPSPANEEDPNPATLVPYQRPKTTSRPRAVSCRDSSAVHRPDPNEEAGSVVRALDQPTEHSSNSGTLVTFKRERGQQKQASKRPRYPPPSSSKGAVIHDPRQALDNRRPTPHAILDGGQDHAITDARRIAQAYMDPQMMQNKDAFKNIESILAAGLQQLGVRSKTSGSSGNMNAPVHGSHSRAEQLENHQCHYCSKIKKTQSQLNKDDWKRHERDIHPNISMDEAFWCPLPHVVENSAGALPDAGCSTGHRRCSDNKVPNTQICQRVVYTKRDFYEHLHSHHNIPEPVLPSRSASPLSLAHVPSSPPSPTPEDQVYASRKAARKKIKHHGRIGRNGTRGFWCGFCNRVIQIPKMLLGKPAWDERFRHVDTEHYRHGEKVDKWVVLGSGATKSALAKQEKTEYSAEEAGSVAEEQEEEEEEEAEEAEAAEETEEAEEAEEELQQQYNNVAMMAPFGGRADNNVGVYHSSTGFHGSVNLLPGAVHLAAHARPAARTAIGQGSEREGSRIAARHSAHSQAREELEMEEDNVLDDLNLQSKQQQRQQRYHISLLSSQKRQEYQFSGDNPAEAQKVRRWFCVSRFTCVFL
ncbi:MAG: hypothetical protein Q9163_003089 [Psora crenata]